jgi:hypothetical protein
MGVSLLPLSLVHKADETARPTKLVYSKDSRRFSIPYLEKRNVHYSSLSLLEVRRTRHE